MENFTFKSKKMEKRCSYFIQIYGEIKLLAYAMICYKKISQCVAP